ncbi:3020_t:CDS:2 [Acaulospora colombiana]|uniref:3020_t:CDS:1 n=1 Tax=Acaulospora colombiana TaxID=27376 RepID=A0ACA9L499_9GLOM|nr:3020_t:CDS:2 [Acaulospora colombiana]
MLDLHHDFNEALSNTTRQNIEPALGKKRTKDEAEFDTDSGDTLSDDDNKENFDEPEMEEEVTLFHKRKREVSGVDLLDTIQVPKIELLRKRSALLDSSTSEYQYRDEIVNPLLSSIFYDTENALWLKTH